MDATTPIIIEAHVESSEQPGLIAAAEQLSDCLNAVSNTKTWQVRLRFRAPGTDIDPSLPQSAIIVSLLPETKRAAEPIAATKARWRSYLGRLQALGPPVFIRTVFRHVRDRAWEAGATQLLERIRRLNRMAVELSHELGVAVIEVDRAFAHIGGRALESDYRLTGPLAAEVSGHTTVWSLLSFGLDDAIDPELQEMAKAHLGGLDRIDAFVRRRLAAGPFASEIIANTTDEISNPMLVRYSVLSTSSISNHKISSILLKGFRLALVIGHGRLRRFIGRSRLRSWGVAFPPLLRLRAVKGHWHRQF